MTLRMDLTEEHEIAAADGQRIVARFFAPAGPPTAAVLIVPAMGVVQDYYASFATWLAAQGFLAATFDYRGMGLSRTNGLRGFRATVVDWAELDCAAMIEATSMRAPGKPFYWIGHSLGGQILAFVPNHGRISKAVTVATGSGYWRENALALRRRAWFLWHVLVPLTVPLFGYFPGKRLHIVGDLPKGVIQQWRRWCLNPEYAAGAEGEWARNLYASVKTPIVSLSFTDDEFMSARNTDSIHGFYVNAPRTLKRLAPGDIDVRRIGHFGFFRPAFEETLWRRYLLPELITSSAVAT